MREVHPDKHGRWISSAAGGCAEVDCLKKVFLSKRTAVRDSGWSRPHAIPVAQPKGENWGLFPRRVPEAAVNDFFQILKIS